MIPPTLVLKAVLIAFLGIDLSQPPDVPVTGRTYLDLGMEVAKLESLQIGSGCRRYGLTLNQGRGNSNGVVQRELAEPKSFDMEKRSKISFPSRGLFPVQEG
jgi:hypothetical protein